MLLQSSGKCASEVMDPKNTKVWHFPTTDFGFCQMNKDHVIWEAKKVDLRDFGDCTCRQSVLYDFV